MTAADYDKAILKHLESIANNIGWISLFIFCIMITQVWPS